MPPWCPAALIGPSSWCCLLRRGFLTIKVYNLGSTPIVNPVDCYGTRIPDNFADLYHLYNWKRNQEINIICCRAIFCGFQSLVVVWSICICTDPAGIWILDFSQRCPLVFSSQLLSAHFNVISLVVVHKKYTDGTLCIGNMWPTWSTQWGTFFRNEMLEPWVRAKVDRTSHMDKTETSNNIYQFFVSLSGSMIV